MTVWEGVIPSIKNLAYIFNKRQDNSIKYADAPYMPQIIDLAWSSITNILKKELYKKDQIKSVLVIHTTYIKYKYKGIGDSTDIKNYDTSYHHPYHRSNMHVLLLENNIDQHLTQSVGKSIKRLKAI